MAVGARLHDAGMQIEIVRHDGRAENAERQIEHFRIADDLGRREEALDHGAPLRIGQEDLHAETQRDDAEQRDDEGFDPAEAELLQIEDEEDVERRDQHAEFERNAEDQVEADRRADHLGDVGRDDGDFRKSPERHGNEFRIGVPAGLRQIAAGGDGKAGAERLQHDRHEVRKQRDGQQRVAEFRAAGERRRPVAGVHVADRDHVAGAGKGGDPPAVSIRGDPYRRCGRHRKAMPPRGRAANRSLHSDSKHPCDFRLLDHCPHYARLE